MTAYRDEMCVFCDGGAVEHCPRCQGAVCAGHGLAGATHCAMCKKELKDDFDVASFNIVHDVPPDSGALVHSRGSVLETILGPVVRRVQLFFVKRRVERVFAARTPDQIAAWRRQAGVRPAR